MSEVQRYYAGKYGLVEGEALGRLSVVLAADFDNANRLFLDAAERCIASERREKELQALLTAADERADVLEGLLRDVSESVVGRKGTFARIPSDWFDRVDAALNPAEPPLPEGWYGVDCEQNNREPGISVRFGSGTEISSYGKCSRYLPFKMGVEIHCGASVNGVIYYCEACKPAEPAKCERCGCSTVETCDERGCGYLGAGNVAAKP